ncbi:MAG: hypothetical protein J0M12_05835 [Deltaproteobacteria bacterium]|nr:hypothetical protein [Deltaproteobacteria bacterium]
MNKLKLLLCSCALLLAPRCVRADVAVPPVFLSQPLQVSFAPEDVFFLVDGAAPTVQRIRALVLPVNEAAGSFIAGARLDGVSDPEKLHFAVLVLGKGNQFEMLPSQRFEPAAEGSEAQSVEGLQDALAARRSVLQSFNLQVQSQEESLRRLRQDAEVIGNFGRVTETSDEIERMKMDIANAEKSAQSMEMLIRMAASAPVPKNAIARETQLTLQLGELAQAAKSTESAEMSRKSGMETDLRQKLAIVESSRFEDYDALQRQLDELRSKREALEKQRGGSSPASANATPVAVSPDVDY